MQADDDTILRTKLHRPRLPADFVSRTRLLDLIGLNCAHPVVIVSAPAGYGKSLLVKEPGPDVLRLRVAITDLVPNKPEASVATLVIPFSWIPDAGSGVAKGEAGSTVLTGQATIEVEALAVTAANSSSHSSKPSPARNTTGHTV